MQNYQCPNCGEILQASANSVICCPACGTTLATPPESVPADVPQEGEKQTASRKPGRTKVLALVLLAVLLLGGGTIFALWQGGVFPAEKETAAVSEENKDKTADVIEKEFREFYALYQQWFNLNYIFDHMQDTTNATSRISEEEGVCVEYTLYKMGKDNIHSLQDLKQAFMPYCTEEYYDDFAYLTHPVEETNFPVHYIEKDGDLYLETLPTGWEPVEPFPETMVVKRIDDKRYTVTVEANSYSGPIEYSVEIVWTSQKQSDGTWKFCAENMEELGAKKVVRAVHGNSVSVYKKPDQNSTVIMTIANGTQVIEKKGEGGWSEIQDKEKEFTGWVLQENLLYLYEVEEESEAAHETENTSEKRDDWRTAYSAYLHKALQDGTYTSSAYFRLCYITGDDIPELVVAEGSGHISAVNIFTCRGTEVVQLDESHGGYGSLYYSPYENVLVLHNYINGDPRTYTTVADVGAEEGKWQCAWYEDEDTCWEVNGVEVSQSVFEEAYQENVPQVLGAFDGEIASPLTEENIDSEMRVPQEVGFYTVNTKKDDLRVRYTPSAETEDSVAGFLPKGTRVYVSACRGDWAFVRVGDVSGWVAKSFLQRIS